MSASANSARDRAEFFGLGQCHWRPRDRTIGRWRGAIPLKQVRVRQFDGPLADTVSGVASTRRGNGIGAVGEHHPVSAPFLEDQDFQSVIGRALANGGFKTGCRGRHDPCSVPHAVPLRRLSRGDRAHAFSRRALLRGPGSLLGCVARALDERGQAIRDSETKRRTSGLPVAYMRSSVKNAL